MSTLYHRTYLAETLKSTLEELKNQNKITEDIKNKTLNTFDEIMIDELGKNTKLKCSINGKVSTFRYCDDIWIFHCKEFSIKCNDRETFTSDKLRIVACSEEKISPKKKNEQEDNN
jgi:transcription initiation factor TFIIA small subunit